MHCKTRDIGRRHCLESKPKPDIKLTNHISPFLAYANHSHTALRANNREQGTANVRLWCLLITLHFPWSLVCKSNQRRQLLENSSCSLAIDGLHSLTALPKLQLVKYLSNNFSDFITYVVEKPLKIVHVS